MSQYRECPVCGAALDPGEHCDCENAARTDDHPELDDLDPVDNEERM